MKAIKIILMATHLAPPNFLNGRSLPDNTLDRKHSEWDTPIVHTDVEGEGSSMEHEPHTITNHD